MKRWNGWGDTGITVPLPDPGAQLLLEALGPGTPPQDATREEVLAAVPASQLPSHGLISTEATDRLMHACGQSLPDWIALRSGRIPRFPDGVAFPMEEAHVHELLLYSKQQRVSMIPYGGGTSVAGHIDPQPEGGPTLCIDMGRMNRLLSLDPRSLLATFGAGAAGPNLEAGLRAHGCTLGHFPQSFEFSTLGGWVATRSSGQESLGYGGIDDLFAGGRLETPCGPLELPSFPRSAAGPDLRQLVLGSEGRLGILTHVTVRATLLPEKEEFEAVFFPDFPRGQEAVRRMLQSGLPLSMLRLSTPAETATALALAGHERLIRMLGRVLSLRGIREQKCLLVIGFKGREAVVKAARNAAFDITSSNKGFAVGKQFGSRWRKSRFRMPYLRNTLWEMGYAVDSVETAVDWSRVDAMISALEGAIHRGLESLGERVHVATHISHVYLSGSNVYTTFLFRAAPDPEETLHRWRILKKAACEAIVVHGGTISHQHGVGTDHLPYLDAEKGSLGIRLLREMCRQLDPEGIMNPGKLINRDWRGGQTSE